MSITLTALQKQRRDTAANWTSVNPTLLAGEIGIESDTNKWKVGTGSAAWTSLGYAIGGTYPLVNADISATAEIAVSKLADGTPRQLLQTDAAGTGVEWASNIDVPGTLDVTSAATFDSTVAVTGALTKSGSNVVTVGDTGTVTSTMILDGTILNADINASAAIVDTKLATIATAGKVSGTAITSGNISTSGSLTSTSTITGTALHVQGGLPQVFVSNSASTAADKFAHICGLQRANNTEPEGFSIIGAGGTSTENTVYIGGFFGEANASTSVQFFTAANNTTRSGTERARIDSSGRLLVGTSSALASLLGYTPLFQVQSSTVENASASITSTSSNAFSGGLLIAKARGASAVQDNDGLGQIRFGGYDGSGYIQAARIAVDVDGTPGTNDMPGRLVFFTTADGASSPTERLRITSAGVLQIADAGNITVGTTTGTKIGTATTQKLGFYNATPVVQPTAVADATTAVDVITQLNALLAKLRTLGIIAT